MLLSDDDLLKKAERHKSDGEIDAAQRLYHEVLESPRFKGDPKALVEVYFSLANIFHVKGEIGRAIESFNKVLDLEPNHTDASISLSVLYNDVGRYEDAKKVFERADKRVKGGSGDHLLEDKHINKKFASKHYELAEMYMSYHRYDEALFEYNKVMTLNPEDLGARIKIAKVYAKKKFLNKAFDELKKLKNEHPKCHDARIALGILYYGSGKVLEAQNEWERVLSMSPMHEEAKMYINLSKTATETRL